MIRFFYLVPIVIKVSDQRSVQLSNIFRVAHKFKSDDVVSFCSKRFRPRVYRNNGAIISNQVEQRFSTEQSISNIITV